MSRLRLYLLGPPRLELDGEPVHLPRRKALALLAYLAVTGRPHSRDSLATLLRAEYDQRSARADLSRTLSRLNRALGQHLLVADRATVGLDPELRLWLDTAALCSTLASSEALERSVQACDRREWHPALRGVDDVLRCTDSVGRLAIAAA